jgi:hypothetical protein
LGNASSTTIGAPRSAHTAARRERLFFSGMAIALTLTVFAGFSRTYYLHDIIASPFQLSPLLHLHAAAYTAWMLLLVTQTSLIAANRADLHRRLGVAGVALALLMIMLGTTVAISRTAQGLMLDRGVPPLVFLVFPLLGMVVFGGLLGAAIYLRRRGAAHKRLVIFATFELATAAIARWPIIDTWGPLGFFAVIDLFVAAIIVYDLKTLKRLHPATLWGGLFFLASQPARLLIGDTAAWLAFATWITS